MSTTKFNVSIPVLGQAGIILWNNSTSHQPAMAGMKSLYADDYILVNIHVLLQIRVSVHVHTNATHSARCICVCV